MKLSEVIKNPLKLIFSIGMHGGFRFLDDESYLKLMYRCQFGRKPDLDNPKTFTEKLQWLKLHDRKPEYTTMVDKYAVKQYVADMIGQKYIIPTLGVWDNFDDIDFDKLPDQFVLKCTHDSGGLVICRDKSKFNVKKARRIISRCLKRNYYWIGREWQYKDIRPRIIAEKYLQDGEHIVPEDYKIYCINGKPKYIAVYHNRYKSDGNISQTTYTTDWEPRHISFNINHEISDIVEPKPKCLDELLEVCEILCKGHTQVRIDFYIIENQIYFGEITLSNTSGLKPMYPEEIDLILGDEIKLF